MARELIIFDGLAIPNGDISESFSNIENISQSEAGTDIGNVVRLQKLTLTVTLKSDGILKEQVLAKGRLTSGLLEYRNRKVNARLRVSASNFERDSEKIEGIDGLWTTSFEIVEE